LDKGELHLDAYFNQDDENVQTLLETIQTAGHEIGLHGVIHSAESNRIMAEQKTTLNQILKQQVFGVRQHFLRYKIPETAKIHKKQHFLYDATLGFATYEGFRNGISYPFKLYNFDEEKAFPQWEIPMIVMDRTLLAYRKMNYQTARKHLNNIISEVEKFNGVFSLLWHNGYLNELEQKGITRFYTDILDSLPDTFQKKVTGKQIIKAYQHNIHNFSTIADKIHE
jgi:peptidoglycan/xylan/chitin deacetylase (PgdA/CDA1 family)